MKFDCIMIGRVTVPVELPDGTYYNHSILDTAIKEKYAQELGMMLLENSHMEHFTRLRE